MPYTIPEALHAEIDELEALIQRFRSGDLDPVTMKAKRVPFGVYEQRTPGTYMTRIRCTGGTITPSQFARVAELAAEYGSPFVHLTTRQDIQIHDVDLGRVPSLSRELAAIGLSSRGGGGNTVRNILASEDAGQNLSELFDVGPWVDALTDRVIREGDSWNLPRKFKISFAANDADSSLAGFNDLGFFPRLGPDGEPGFKVYVAGGLGGKPRTALPFEEFVPAVEVHLVVTAIKKFFDKNGNRKNKRAARLRFLRDKFGDEGLLAELREAVVQERASGWEPLVPKVARSAWLRHLRGRLRPRPGSRRGRAVAFGRGLAGSPARRALRARRGRRTDDRNCQKERPGSFRSRAFVRPSFRLRGAAGTGRSPSAMR